MSETSGSPGHAFISYVHEDSLGVDRLQRVLQEAGIRVWRNTADLWPGQDWRLEIRRAITDDALVFLACFSHSSLARRKSYQNEELALAISQIRLRMPGEPWLIPVRFDDCIIPDIEIGGGRSLRSLHRADLFGHQFEESAARLAVAVQRILQRHSSAPPRSAGPASEARDRGKPMSEDKPTITFNNYGPVKRQIGYVDTYNENVEVSAPADADKADVSEDSHDGKPD